MAIRRSSDSPVTWGQDLVDKYRLKPDFSRSPAFLFPPILLENFGPTLQLNPFDNANISI
jgi:hypothetical protein